MKNRMLMRSLLRVLAQRWSFYILGAGVSMPLIPPTPGLRALVGEEYEAIGAFAPRVDGPSPLFERVIRAPRPRVRDFVDRRLDEIGDTTLEFLVQRSLWIPNSGIIPLQYALFEKVASPSTIFSFNLDGLAKRYLRGIHFVLEPHGSIDPEWFEDDRYEEWRDDTVLGAGIPFIRYKLLPGPEPLTTTSRSTYQLARHLLPRAQAAIIMGYTFGRTPRGFDDAESLEFFVEQLRRHPRALLVVSPTPEELTGILRERLHSGNVHALSLYWHVFSSCLLSLTMHQPLHDGLLTCHFLKSIVRAYNVSLDRGWAG